MTSKYPIGDLIAEGKTKKVHRVLGVPGLVKLTSKDDITAGNGEKHDVIPGKGRLANATTCNVFRLLRQYGIPVAFTRQDGPDAFVAQECVMLPYEVVVRREAHGSYLKRHPNLWRGFPLPSLVVEFFLKTSGKTWGGIALECDAPLLVYEKDQKEVHLFRPSAPLQAQQPFVVLKEWEIFGGENNPKLFPRMRDIALMVYRILEESWVRKGHRLADLKLAFGIDFKGILRLADVIDNDSWTIVERDGSYLDGGNLAEVLESYQLVAKITGTFQVSK